MAVPNNFVFAQFRERGFEFDIAAEGLIDRAHERIENIVADPGQSAKAYQFTGALLRATAADIDEVGMILRQAQLRPGFSESARRTLLAARVDFVGAAVVEQVEFEQLDTLIFEVEERAVEAAPVGAKKAERGGQASGAAPIAARGPISRPVEPWCVAPPNRRLAAAAARRVFGNVAEKPIRAIGRDGAKTTDGVGDTTTKARMAEG